MKKIVVSMFSIVLIFSLVYTSYKVTSLRNENKGLEKKIVNIKEDTEKEKENSTKYSDKKDTLEKESKNKLEEFEIWKKAVEKLEKALN